MGENDEGRRKRAVIRKNRTAPEYCVYTGVLSGALQFLRPSSDFSSPHVVFAPAIPPAPNCMTSRRYAPIGTATFWYVFLPPARLGLPAQFPRVWVYPLLTHAFTGTRAVPTRLGVPNLRLYFFLRRCDSIFFYGRKLIRRVGYLGCFSSSDTTRGGSGAGSQDATVASAQDAPATAA